MKRNLLIIVFCLSIFGCKNTFRFNYSKNLYQLESIKELPNGYSLILVKNLESKKLISIFEKRTTENSFNNKNGLFILTLKKIEKNEIRNIFPSLRGRITSISWGNNIAISINKDYYTIITIKKY